MNPSKMNLKRKRDHDGKITPVSKSTLPVTSCRGSLMEELNNHSTLILVGETGSGKTTQIPQFIYDDNKHKKKCIAITQPRRIAAISMAKRVAEERQENIGETVGYSVRFEDTTSDKTFIKYMTDGMLLREAMLDSCVKRYSWIILDEAHERTIHTDVLFGVIKAAQQSRSKLKPKKRLKIIIMSATMDVDRISSFFNQSKVIYIQGREHQVDINYLKNPVEDYTQNVLKTVFQLHQELPIRILKTCKFSSTQKSKALEKYRSIVDADTYGLMLCPFFREHVLVFLTGQEEIESMAHTLRIIISSNSSFKSLDVQTLYASLSYEAQMRALSIPEQGVRRCILSTNVAETSLTIPGIRVVIDSGKVKTRYHIRGTGVDCLQVVPISQAQAWQRSGRAGRLDTGKCYRLYTADEFAKMESFPIPEIQRSNMSSVVLHLAKIGIITPLSFDWIDGPDKEVLVAAINELKMLGAIECAAEPVNLTDVGKLMAIIPLDPPLAKVLINAKQYEVLEPVLTILSILSSESLYQSCDGKRQALKKRFCTPEGDLIAYLKIFREYKKTATKNSWCKLNGFSLRALQFAAKVRLHLKKLCEREGIPLTSALTGTKIFENIRKCFFESLPQNYAVHVQGNRYMVKSPGKPGIATKIHPSSTLFNCRLPFVMFTEIIQISKESHLMSNVSLVDPEWVKSINIKRHEL